MAKMTPARAARWQKDLTKALELIERTCDDLGSAKVSATGTDSYKDLIEAGGSLVPVSMILSELAGDDVRRSPIARINNRLLAASEERKRLKAERDAAKVGVS